MFKIILQSKTSILLFFATRGPRIGPKISGMKTGLTLAQTNDNVGLEVDWYRKV